MRAGSTISYRPTPRNSPAAQQHPAAGEELHLVRGALPASRDAGRGDGGLRVRDRRCRRRGRVADLCVVYRRRRLPARRVAAARTCQQRARQDDASRSRRGIPPHRSLAPPRADADAEAPGQAEAHAAPRRRARRGDLELVVLQPVQKALQLVLRGVLHGAVDAADAPPRAQQRGKAQQRQRGRSSASPGRPPRSPPPRRRRPPPRPPPAPRARRPYPPTPPPGSSPRPARPRRRPAAPGPWPRATRRTCASARPIAAAKPVPRT